jgi:hypothetical protein
MRLNRCGCRKTREEVIFNIIGFIYISGMKYDAAKYFNIQYAYPCDGGGKPPADPLGSYKTHQ